MSLARSPNRSMPMRTKRNTCTDHRTEVSVNDYISTGPPKGMRKTNGSNMHFFTPLLLLLLDVCKRFLWSMSERRHEVRSMTWGALCFLFFSFLNCVFFFRFQCSLLLEHTSYIFWISMADGVRDMVHELMFEFTHRTPYGRQSDVFQCTKSSNHIRAKRSYCSSIHVSEEYGMGLCGGKSGAFIILLRLLKKICLRCDERVPRAVSPHWGACIRE